jgi:hypothetical protein
MDLKKIVVPLDGSRLWPRWQSIMGSVAESVLRGTTTPILLLRADGAPVARPNGTACPVEETHA